MSTLVLIVGLTVSLIGTLVMTIPLISQVRVLFEFGKLKEAKRSLRYNRLEQGDVGFEEIASRHLKTKEYGDEVDTSEIEYITHEPKLSADFNTAGEETTYTGSSTTDLIFVKYSLDEDTDHGIGSSYNENLHKFYQLFEPDMRQGEQRIRLIGVVLLALGFLLQIISILI